MTTIAPSGHEVSISAGGYEAVVCEVGAALRSLTLHGRPLVLGFEHGELPTGGSGQVLAPWPNRVRDGRYTFGGQAHQLALTEPLNSNAIHGLVRWVPWGLSEGPSSVRCSVRVPAQPGYPWSLDLRVDYLLSPAGLAVHTTARNRSTTPAPYAHGMHPYLVAGPGGIDDWTLELPAGTWVEVDQRGLPGIASPVDDTAFDFRTPRRIGGTRLDHPLTGLHREGDGRAYARLITEQGQGTELWVDPAYPWLQVFTGDTLGGGLARRALAVEPMTGPPDAFNSSLDLVVLEPGAEHTASWGLAAL